MAVVRPGWSGVLEGRHRRDDERHGPYWQFGFGYFARRLDHLARIRERYGRLRDVAGSLHRERDLADDAGGGLCLPH
jgi:hypothetical protein